VCFSESSFVFFPLGYLHPTSFQNKSRNMKMFTWISHYVTTLRGRPIPEISDWLFEGLFIYDKNCRKGAQTEDYIKEIEERQKLSPPPYEGSKPELDLGRSEGVARFYWKQERAMRLYEMRIPRKLQAAYFEWHATPKWYMHPELIKVCIAEGSCCSRDCGCCEKRELNPGRTRGLGHCTTECGCCAELRGFTLTYEEKVQANKASGIEMLQTTDRSHYRRIKQAFMLGTVHGEE